MQTGPESKFNGIRIAETMLGFAYAIARLPVRRTWLARKIVVRTILSEGRTMVCARRLNHLFEICRKMKNTGAAVECGVAKGGCLAAMAVALPKGTRIWGFDSFLGMPDLTAEDMGSGQFSVGRVCAGPDGQAAAADAVAKYDVHRRATVVSGWFQDTLPKVRAEIGPIALLRLDNDWYESTKFCLETLYDQVVPGGYVLIDDYHTFVGCKMAVDQFRKQRGIESELVTVEPGSEVYWRK